MIDISLIAAVADNRVIGSGQVLPWHLPNDLKYFRDMTIGKPIIMGRLTFDSVGSPLPGRKNIVVSRTCNLDIENIIDDNDSLVYDDTVSPSLSTTSLTIGSISTDEGVIAPLGIGEMTVRVRY